MPLSNATKLLSMVLLAFFKVALVSAVTPTRELSDVEVLIFNISEKPVIRQLAEDPDRSE
jgi:hypothetical protein